MTNNEGISGNQVVDPNTGNVFIAHTTANTAAGRSGLRGQDHPGHPDHGDVDREPEPRPGAVRRPGCTDSAGNPEELAGENFASIARDSAGYLYVTFTAGALDHASSSDPTFGALTAPEQIYVVHSLQPAGADPATLTWSAPQKITGTGASAGTNTFPWITAGSDGRVDVAWYHAPRPQSAGPAPAGRAHAPCTAPRT